MQVVRECITLGVGKKPSPSHDSNRKGPARDLYNHKLGNLDLCDLWSFGCWGEQSNIFGPNDKLPYFHPVMTGIQGDLLRVITLPETNIAHENPIFPGKYHQNGGFSMAMLVYRRVYNLDSKLQRSDVI